VLASVALSRDIGKTKQKQKQKSKKSFTRNTGWARYRWIGVYL